jgi:hypothetical protein
LDEKGKVIYQDSILFLQDASVEEVVLFYQTTPLLLTSSKHFHHIHVCPPQKDDEENDEEREKACKCFWNTSTSIIFEDSLGDEFEEMTMEMKYIYENFKLYQVKNQQIIETVISKREGKLERSIAIPNSPPIFGSNLSKYCSHGDNYLLVCFVDVDSTAENSYRKIEYKLILFDFFEEKFKIYNELLTDYPCEMIMNTSFYDSSFAEKVGKILDPFLPRDLIKLLF